MPNENDETQARSYLFNPILLEAIWQAVWDGCNHSDTIGRLIDTNEIAYSDMERFLLATGVHFPIYHWRKTDDVAPERRKFLQELSTDDM
jgi:hypothetical protein